MWTAVIVPAITPLVRMPGHVHLGRAFLFQPTSTTISLPSYLVLLASRGKLGPSEQDVAAHLVIREVDLMMAVDYHEKKLPEPK
jgi:hypothetical protein